MLAVKGREFSVFYCAGLKKYIETARGLCHGVARLPSATFTPSFRPSAELNSEIRVNDAANGNENLAASEENL